MKEMKKRICLVLVVLMLASTLFVGCDEILPEDAPTGEDTPADGANTPVDEPSAEDLPDATKMTYDAALSCLEKGEIEEAYALFLSIPDYRDVSEHLERFVYRYGKQATHSSAGNSISYYQYNQYGQETEFINGNSMTYKSYDDKGKLLYEIAANGSKNSCTYDDCGLLIKNEHYSAYYNKIADYDTYSYNEDGKKIEQSYYVFDALSHRYTYEYDEAGRLIREHFFDRNVEQSVTEFAYDSSGNLISKKKSRDNGTCFLTQYTYNERGLLVLEEETSSNLEMITRITKEYDENGNLTRRTYQYRDDYTQEYTYEYNDAGQRVKMTWTFEDQLTEVETYEYDEHGNVTRKTWHRYADDGTVQSYSVYDYFDYRLYYNPVSENEPYTLVNDYAYGGK